MITGGLQDAVMDEYSIQERGGYTCKLLDAIFSALHESECLSLFVDHVQYYAWLIHLYVF